MSREVFNNALNYIDYSLVEEYIVEKELLQKRAQRRRAVAQLAPLAACFIVFVCILTLLFGGDYLEGVVPLPNGKPSTDMDESIPQYDKAYVFEYNGQTYLAFFMDGSGSVIPDSDDTADSAPIIPDGDNTADSAPGPTAIGEYLGEVVATNTKNGEEGIYKIYASLFDPTGEIIIEIDGEYYSAVINQNK